MEGVPGRWALPLVLALLVACGARAETPLASPAATTAGQPQLLVIEGDMATTLVRGTTVRTLPSGVLSPAGDLLVAADIVPGTKKTVVRGITLAGDPALDLALGDEYTLPTAYGPAPSGFSPNGKWLVLVSRDANESRFAVIDATRSAVAQIVILSSRFTFDAIHNDGSAMYLIEHPRAGSTSYNVRRYDLNARALDPAIIFDKTQIAQFDPTLGLMDGTFHVSVAPKTGDWTYGLYMRPNGAPFVHALNVPGRYAQCIVDLAGTWTSSALFSMALSDDGRRLYVVDTAGGTASAIDALRQKVVRTSRFGARSGAGDPRATSAVVSPDGTRLYATAPRGIAMIQTSDLTLRGWVAPDLVARSLAISADGARLFALAADGVHVVELASGRDMGVLVPAPGARAIHLITSH